MHKVPTIAEALKNLVEAIEAGITSETLIRCSPQDGSYLGEAKKALECSTARK